jgi:hypothetical protein
MDLGGANFSVPLSNNLSDVSDDDVDINNSSGSSDENSDRALSIS